MEVPEPVPRKSIVPHIDSDDIDDDDDDDDECSTTPHRTYTFPRLIDKKSSFRWSGKRF